MTLSDTCGFGSKISALKIISWCAGTT